MWCKPFFKTHYTKTITCNACYYKNPPDPVLFDFLMDFQAGSTKILVREAFSATTGIEVNSPNVCLCNPCFEKLKVAYKFRIDAIESNLKISQLDDDLFPWGYSIQEAFDSSQNDEPQETLPKQGRKIHNESSYEYPMCMLCGEDFVTLHLYREHYERKHLKKPDQKIEELIAQTFVTGSDYEYLEDECNNRTFKKFQCKRCDTVCNGMHPLTDHLKVVHQIYKPFKCLQCQKDYQTFQLLSRHMRNNCHGFKKPPTINLEQIEEDPDREPLDLSDFEEFEADGINKTRFVKCKRCEAILKSTELVEHLDKVHLIVRAFKCETCMKRFQNAQKYQAHKKRFKGLCMSSMVQENGAKNVAENWKKYIDAKCSKCFDFDDPDKYSAHQEEVHKIQKPFRCICRFQVKTYKKLSVHMFCCKSVLPNQCTQCAKQFSTPHHLMYHINSKHNKNDELSLNCTKCERTFVTADALENHEKIKHLHLSPFSCKLCYKKFQKKNLIKDHILKQHFFVDLGCVMCTVKFSTKDRYRFHLIKKHQKDPKYDDAFEKLQKMNPEVDPEPFIIFNPEFKNMP